MNSIRKKMKNKQDSDDDSDETWDSDDDDETIARIQRAHFAQAAAMGSRRRPAARPRPMSHKRKMEAVKTFHDFTKKLKKDTGITIRSLVGNNILELSDLESESSMSDSDGLSEEEFTVNPNAVKELNDEDDSYIDPETGDFVTKKKPVTPEKEQKEIVEPPIVKKEESPPKPMPIQTPRKSQTPEEPKTLSISDIISEGDLDLTNKNVEISEVEESELCPKAEDLLDLKQEDGSQDYDITEKLKEMGEISVKPLKKEEEEGEEPSTGEKKPENEDEKKATNTSALNVRRNIREVMDEKNLDASTLAAQRQESERLARVQEQQRIIREVQRQIAINRQNKIHQKTLSLLQGGSSILKKGPGHKLNLPNTVLVKLPSGEVKKTTMKQGQVEVTKVPKPTTSGTAGKREVVEIVDSSSGEESSSSSSDSDDCIMLSDSEVPPSPEAEEDPHNSGLHVNDSYNVPDEQGRVLINIGHPENEEDIFLAPQIARVIKPHQIGGVRFLFDNIIESVERFSTSTGFGCILAHSMGLGKTLQIVCFCDIFLRHTTSKTVLCIMPINTLQNWVAEFNMWLPLDATNSPLAAHGEVRSRNFPIYVLNDSHKTLAMRAKVVKDWKTTGGVLMIGYELYRLLSMKKDKKPRKKKKADAKAEAEKEKEKADKPEGADDTQISDESKLDKEDVDPHNKLDAEIRDEVANKEEKKEDTPNDEDKKLLDEMYEALVRPGPDLVICDEGHRIKNSHSNISYALKQMRTKRRVVLTGYPLQNNLLEYWCMVDFVRPNYLGSKTEFCNMFERPIQNGQCIDSTPQDIRLMRYRAHVLHSLLVGFVQRRSHAVLQSTLPQKEEYVLLVRMTPLQRKLYDRFMNEVVRSTSVPNPLKAFAICCKIWNHPDVLYHFLRKRSSLNAAVEEDLDLEELGARPKAPRFTKAGQPRRKPGPKPKGTPKKPAATIPPNTTTGSVPPKPDPSAYGNSQYPPNGPYGQPQGYRPDQQGPYPPYPANYQNPNSGYYPPNPQYNQNYDSNFYQQQPPYSNNYPNQYPQNNPDCNQQQYNQNYWGNGNYYGNSGFYNNSQYPNNQPPQGEYSNQQYPSNYNAPPNDPSYQGNAMQPYQNNQDGYGNQRPPYPGYNQPGYPEYNQNAVPPPYPSNSSTTVPPYPSNTPSQVPPYPSNSSSQVAPPYPSNSSSQVPPPYPSNSSSQVPSPYPSNSSSQVPPPYPSNSSSQDYSNQSFPPSAYSGDPAYAPGTQSTPYNQYDNQPQNYPGYQNNSQSMPNQPENSLPTPAIKDESTTRNFPINEMKAENATPSAYNDPSYGYPPNTSNYQAPGNTNGNYTNQYPNPFPPHLETKPPLGSASSGSPVTSWPITELKTEVDRLKAEEKVEMKSESDGEVKIEDLDTKKIVRDDGKTPAIETIPMVQPFKTEPKVEPLKKPDETNPEKTKTDSESEEEEKTPKRGRPKQRKGKDGKKPEKAKAKPKSKAKGRKDRKKSKDNNKDESESEDSEEKPNREEELALVKKAEEMTYDWAAELLKDYIPGIIENSAKMELFFYILNESIKLGDRILLFSQSLFTLNLIEDFLERNYIPGTNCLWERNTSYYRLDGSTHALEREKLINEFNTNPHIYLFLVSTRAGSLGINLVGANRVIVFDASWNPCHDTQAVCRVYRYGQKKPCFVYRFVMDWCLEKKIYDRQINKQGMADRVVDECNPDAVLSMKEITNLCFDNDEKESDPKDLSEHKDKYIDMLMQGIMTQHWKLLSKEPFQHESLLVDRKEKKLSSAEKRLAQRGYELEKKAALAPKPQPAYRTVRTADGALVQRPVASVRPMQHAARWIPADVWRRQGMTAQEMTLPLDVVIPTNSAEKTNIVLKAGQRVMVLKSPKGIYMQLESGKIIAIKTSFKGLGGAGQKDSKEGTPVGKKVMGSRPVGNIPGALKNNAAITITSRTPRGGYQRVMSRPNMLGQHKLARPMIPGQKIAELRSRLGDLKSYQGMRPRSPVPHPRLLKPSLPGSVSITKIPKDAKKSDNDNSDSNPAGRMDVDSDDDTQVLDSDDEDKPPKSTTNVKETDRHKASDKKRSDSTEDSKSSDSTDKPKNSEEPKSSEPLVLTTDEKLPAEDHFEDRSESLDLSKVRESNRPMSRDMPTEQERSIDQDRSMEHGHLSMDAILSEERLGKKTNPLKNYRHQRLGSRQQNESSLSQLERTASVISKEGMPDFRKNLDDITQSYSPSNEEKPAVKSKKKKSPNKSDIPEAVPVPPSVVPSVNPSMSHSVSNLLGPGNSRKNEQITAPVAPLEGGTQPRMPIRPPMPQDPHLPPMPHPHHSGGSLVPNAPPVGPPMDKAAPPSALPASPMAPSQAYPAGNPPPEGAYGQYPGYGMGYGAYPNPAYYGGYGGAGYFPPYAPPPAPYAPPPATPPDYLPPNPQW